MLTARFFVGHVLDRLAGLPDESVHCAVTSPPYFGLRDYQLDPQVWGGNPACEHEWGEEVRTPWANEVSGPSENVGKNGAGKGRPKETGPFCRKCGAWRGSLGLEPTIDLYVEHLVAVLREVRRVLRSDGTLWLNLGDSYAGSWGAQGHRVSKSDDASWHRSQIRNHPKRGSHLGTIRAAGLKPKDLIGVPWMVAFALRADGWYLRSDVVWAKPNPMPESVTDRPTRSHEYLFLLTKSQRYYYDHAAIAEPVSLASIARVEQATFDDQTGGEKDYGANGINGSRSARRALENFASKKPDNRRPFAPGQRDSRGDGHDCGGGEERTNGVREPWLRNRRSVWTIPTSSLAEAHFATFPPALVEPCVLAGTSEKGCCSACDAPWRRVVEKSGEWRAQHDRSAKHNGEVYRTNPGGGVSGVNTSRRREEKGWEPTCDCVDEEIVSATVLDPFGGAGTVALVADRLGRNSVSVELNPDYVEIAERRLTRDVGPFLRPEIVVDVAGVSP